MEKMTLKNKILSVIAILLCLVIIGALVQMISTIANANKSSSDEDLSGFDVVFNGKTNILGEDYDIVLKGKDGSFSVDANNMKNIMDGTYSFTEGQGWTFVFDDNLGLNVRSHYKESEKTHQFIYPLDLGSRGAGNILLTSEDKSFKAADEPRDDIPTFTGTADLNVITAEMRLICKADNSFDFFSTNFGQYIPALNGTYDCTDGKYVFHIEGAEYTAELKDGMYSVSMPVSLPVMGVTGIPTEMVQDILTIN